MGYNKAILLTVFMSVVAFINVSGQDSDSIKNHQLEEQNRILQRKLDSVLKFNEFDKRIDLIAAENNGRFESLGIWIGILFTIVIVIAVWNAINTASVAKNEARKAFEEDFDKYCKRVEAASLKAEERLIEMENMASTMNTIKNSKEDSTDKITYDYEAKK